VIEHPVQLVDGVRAKSVAHLAPIERDPHRGVGEMVVIGDVSQVGEAVPDATPTREKDCRSQLPGASPKRRSGVVHVEGDRLRPVDGADLA
jgi:hypothetical protein